MIVNLHGHVNENGEIVFDLVPLYFDVNQTVHVTEVFVSFNKNVNNLHGYITTTLIDKNPVNQKQLLVFLPPSIKQSRHFYNSPTQKSQYKIQCRSLQSATFNLHIFEDTEKFNFRKQGLAIQVYLQLEITTHAGIFNKSKTSQ